MEIVKKGGIENQGGEKENCYFPLVTVFLYM
jgi:hypothetical protein